MAMKRSWSDAELPDDTVDSWLRAITDPDAAPAADDQLSFLEGLFTPHEGEGASVAQEEQLHDYAASLGDSDEVDALAASLPPHYAHTTTLQQKLVHLRMLRELRSNGGEGVLTSWVRSRASEVRGRALYQLHLTFRDRPGSLGAVTSALSQQRANILEASVYVTDDSYGLDTFLVSVANEDISHVDEGVRRALAGDGEGAEGVLGRNRADSSSSSSSTEGNELGKRLGEGAAAARNPLLIEWDQPQFGSLVLHRVLGEGGGSKVWKGLWKGSFVAVKVLKVDPGMCRDALRSFVQEAKILSQIRHPSICTCLGTCMQQGFPAIVLEYLQGGSLHNLLHNREYNADGQPTSALSPRLLCRIALEVATGVAYLHDNSIIHRDVKAANVLLDGKQHAKVTDFGISTKFAPEHTAETGTYRSMAPEVILHKGYNYKCDVYSFGMMLWEIAHQRIPFEEENGLQAAYGVTMEGRRPPVKPKPNLEMLGELIVSCWQQEPAKRPDMDAVVQQLIAIDARVAKAAAATPSAYIAGPALVPIPSHAE